MAGLGLRGPGDDADRTAPGHLLDATPGEIPGAHVARLLLGPDDLGVLVASQLAAISRSGHGYSCSNRTIATGACVSSRRASSSNPNLPVQNTSRVTDAGSGCSGVGEHELERARLERGRGRVRHRHAEVALGRHHDHRLADRIVHLAPEHVEVLRGRGRVDDAHVVLGAQHEEALEPGRRVLRAPGPRSRAGGA